MSTETTRTMFERYAAAINGGSKSPDLVAQFVDDQSLKAHIALFEAGFPGYSLQVQQMVVEGDRVAIQAIFRGVHQGEFQGISPTGREVSVPLMVFYRIADDKIVEHWMNADSLGLLQQLGAIPIPA